MKSLKFFVLALCLFLSACGQQSNSHLTSTQAIAEPQQTKTQSENQIATDTDAEELLTEVQNTEKTHSNIVSSKQTEPDDYDYVLEFPSDSYPETALHIYSAIENGHSDVCTIDRDGADERRKQSLKGISTRDGYDRDEWPMAMCAEGGEGASVAYVDSSDNRGAGSWIGHQLSAYEDGERILFIVAKPKSLFGKTNPNTDKSELKLDEDLQAEVEEPVYKNCTEAHEAGVTPLFEGDPGYSKKLDRDGDGVACEL